MKGKINQRVNKYAHEDSKRQSFWETNKIRKGQDIEQVSLTTDMYILHSIKLSIQVVTETQCNEWPVTSILKPENQYTIKNQQFVKVATYITLGMQHLHTCTCPNSPFNVTMCKHIHLVINI